MTVFFFFKSPFESIKPTRYAIRRVIERMIRAAAAPEVRVAFKDQRPPRTVRRRSVVYYYIFIYDYYCSRAQSEFTQPFAAFPAAPPPTLESRVFVFVFRSTKTQRPQPSSAASPCRGEEGEDHRSRRRRHLHHETGVVPPPPNGGGRTRTSSAANPEQCARERTLRTDDSHAVHASGDDDYVRRPRLCRLPLSTTTAIRGDGRTAAASAALDSRARRYGMYAATTADARYGLRYGLSSSLVPQDTKSSPAAAAFFLR